MAEICGADKQTKKETKTSYMCSATLPHWRDVSRARTLALGRGIQVWVLVALAGVDAQAGLLGDHFPRGARRALAGAGRAGCARQTDRQQGRCQLVPRSQYLLGIAILEQSPETRKSPRHKVSHRRTHVSVYDGYTYDENTTQHTTDLCS